MVTGSEMALVPLLRVAVKVTDWLTAGEVFERREGELRRLFGGPGASDADFVAG